MRFDVYRVNGIAGSEACLIVSGDDAVLVDAGYAIGTGKTIEYIEKHLAGRDLKHIILTHSHYDHVMGTPAVCEYFPQAKVYAHPRVRSIFAKSGAKRTMEELNRAAANDRGVPPEKNQADKLHVDIDVVDGDIIEAGDMRIRVLDTPGHTNDSISLYFESEDMALVSETLGVAIDIPAVIPAFIVSYDDAVESIKKIIEINPEYIVMPHSILISGKDKDIYLQNTLKEAHRLHDIVISSHEKGYSIDKITEILKDIYYVGKFREYQPYDALYANWIPMITRIIRHNKEQIS